MCFPLLCYSIALYYFSSYSETMKLSSKVLEQLSSLLYQDIRIDAAYLLGSAAANRMRRDSDIDLAILPVKGQLIDSLSIAEISTILSFELGRFVDVGLLSSANLIYSRQALETGRRLFMKDAFHVQLMETSLLSMYIWFNEERKEIVNAYRIR